MAVHLPREVVKYMGYLEDGQGDNSLDNLDDGDTLWVDWFCGITGPRMCRTSSPVTDADVENDEALEHFLSRATGGRVDILRDNSGRFQHLVYRRASMNDVYIVDGNGNNQVRDIPFPFAPKSEKALDAEFDDKYARCQGDRTCQNTLENLIRSYKDSIMRYDSAEDLFYKDQFDFALKVDPKDGDVATYLSSRDYLFRAVKTYIKTKDEFENYVSSE